VIWVQAAVTTDGDPVIWLGAIPPATAALSGAALLGVRSAYESLAQLRRFLTRMGYLGIGGAAILAACVAWIAFL